MDLDMERLISLVEERPVLWDKSLDCYKNRRASLIAWREICREIYDDFDNLSDQEQNEFSIMIMKKWTNVKDNWVRFQKKVMEQEAAGITKHRKYIYQKQLAFLKKNLKPYEPDCIAVDNDSQDVKVSSFKSFFERINQRRKFQTPTKESSGKDDYRDIQTADSTKFSDHNSYTRPVPATSSPVENDWHDAQTSETVNFAEHTNAPRIFPTFHRGVKRKKDDIEEQILKILNAPEDRHLCFFKGILPALHQLNEDEVLQFQVGVMEILQNIRKDRNTVQSMDLQQMNILDYTSNSSATYPIIVNCQGGSPIVQNDSETTKTVRRLHRNAISPGSSSLKSDS